MHRINPPSMAAPGGCYSHAVAAGGWVFVSGQLPIAADGTRLAGTPFEQQARQVLANVQSALLACGAGTQDLVQLRVYLTDITQWSVFDTIYAQWIGNHRPARAVVPVPELHHGLAIEIEAMALPNSASGTMPSASGITTAACQGTP